MKRPICRRMSLMALSKLEFVASFRMKNGYISVDCIYKLTRIAHLFFKCIENFIFGHTTQHQIVYFPESEWKWVVCDPNFIYFHSQDAFRETQYKSLAPPNTDSLWKIENSLVSNIYSTPILFFSKWVWIRTRVRHFCISESATKMDELEFSHLRLPCGPSYFKVAKSCSYSWMHNIILIFFMVMDHCSGWLI